MGPAEVLFQRPFFEYIHKALKPGGVLCTQAESLWLHMPTIKEVISLCKSVFKHGTVNYAFTTIPTYPSGQIGLMLCTKGGTILPPNVKRQQRSPPVDSKLPPLRYYDADVHAASFVLPKFAKDELAGTLTS